MPIVRASSKKVKSVKTTYNPSTMTYETKTTYESVPKSSSSSSSGSTSSGGSSSGQDAKLASLQTLKSSLVPESFAYKQVVSDIAQRQAELSGGTYTPSAVVLSKSSPSAVSSDGKIIKFEEETFAATKARQEQQKKDAQAMAIVQQRTQQALETKYGLSGQLEREQAASRVATFADVQAGRLGVRDTAIGTSRAVNPLETAVLKRELASGLLSSQEKGKVTMEDFLFSKTPGRKEVFSTRTGEILKVEVPSKSLPRTVSFKESAVMVREAVKKQAASKGLPITKSFLTTFAKQRAEQRIEDAVKNNAALSGIMGTIIKPFIGRTKVRNDIGLKNIDKEVDRLVGITLKKLGPGVESWRDLGSLSLDATKKRINAVATFGIENVAGAIKLSTLALRTLNNFDKTIPKLASGAIEGGLVSIDVIDKVSPGGFKLTNFVPVGTKKVGKVLDKVSGYEDINGKVLANTVQSLAGGLWEFTNPSTPKGFTNMLMMVGSGAIFNLLKGTGAAVRTGTAGERAAIRVAEARLKGALKKSKPSSVKVSKLGNQYKIEKVGTIKIDGVKVPVKDTMRVSRVKPSDLKKWSDYSDYKLVGKPLVAIRNTYVKAAALVKSLPSRVSSVGKKITKTVRTKEELYQVGNELVLRKVPLTERLFLNKPLILVRGKALTVSKSVSESLRRSAIKTRGTLQKVVRQIRTNKELYQVGDEFVLRKVPLTERFFLDKPLSLVKQRLSKISKSSSSSIKKFTTAVKKIISDIRRKKIFKIGKEVPSLRDNAIIERLSLLEQKRERLILAIKALAKNSSSVQTSRTPFRVILPKVGVRYVTPKLYRRYIGKTLNTNLDEAFKSAGMALKRFDRALEKLVVDLDKGVIITPTNGALLALKRFSKQVSKSERKAMRKEIIKREASKQAEIRPIDPRELALQNIKLKKDISGAFVDANKLKSVLDSKSLLSLSVKPILSNLGKFIKRSPDIIKTIKFYEKNPLLPTGKGACHIAAGKLAKQLGDAGVPYSKMRFIDIKTVSNKGGPSSHVVLKVGKYYLDPTGTQYKFNLGRTSSILRRLPSQYKVVGKRMNVKDFVSGRVGGTASGSLSSAQSSFAAGDILKSATKGKDLKNIVFKDPGVIEVQSGRQILLQKVETVVSSSTPRIKVRRVFKPVSKLKRAQLKASSSGSKLPSSAGMAAIFASPKVKSSLVPVLFPKLDIRQKSELAGALYLNSSLNIASSPVVAQVPVSRQAIASVTVQSPKTALSPLLTTATKTAQALAITSTALLLPQLVPLIRKGGKPIFGSLGGGDGSFKSIHTSRLKNVNYGYLADLYSVVYGDVATAKQKQELTRPGRKFTGLEARRLLKKR